MQRRTFIHLSTFTALALTVPFADGCTSSTDKMIAQPLFFSHLVDVKAINEVGNTYRKLVSAENNKTTLTQLLLGDNNTSKDKESIQTLLDNRVEQDFKTAKTVVVSGWVLSVTEARQCALFSILNA